MLWPTTQFFSASLCSITSPKDGVSCEYIYQVHDTYIDVVEITHVGIHILGVLRLPHGVCVCERALKTLLEKLICGVS